MPRVGDKHYPYTAKGQAAAKAAAKRKGVKVSHGKGYKEGGSVSEKSRVNLGAGAPRGTRPGTPGFKPQTGRDEYDRVARELLRSLGSPLSLAEDTRKFVKKKLRKKKSDK